MIIGGTSDIGRTIAYRLAGDGYALQRAGRDPARLDREVRDLQLRSGGTVTAYICDVLKDRGETTFLDALGPLPDVAVRVVGLLGDQAASQCDPAAAEQVMKTNFIGPALLMGMLAERSERRGSGVPVGVSSAAGGR